MRADTQTVSIEAPAERVVTFLEDPANLPRWAVGFAKAVRRTDERLDGTDWVGGDGHPHRCRRGREARSTSACRPRRVSRCWPLRGWCLAALDRSSSSRNFKVPDMSDQAFASSVETLKHELIVLKALLEVECPL